MSTEAEEETAAADMCCASCGQAEIDDIKLKNCDDGCDLVKYCSHDCQENHRPQHEEECEKRRAELRDRDLFAMPEDISHLGECPICCLPMPLDLQKSILMSCCSQLICNGCAYANRMRELKEGLEQRCAFCREPLITSGEKMHQKRLMKRIKNNCPVALKEMAYKRYEKGDYEAALKYWTKAAEMGHAGAHYQVSNLYYNGVGVEKDMKKYIYHTEEAAIAGVPEARHNLGCDELKNGRFERARKHFTIAANLGDHDSLKKLMALYANGHASKEDYANALRAYQAAVEATKSEEREKAEAWYFYDKIQEERR